jgi:hypothetical protein
VTHTIGGLGKNQQVCVTVNAWSDKTLDLSVSAATQRVCGTTLNPPPQPMQPSTGSIGVIFETPGIEPLQGCGTVPFVAINVATNQRFDRTSSIGSPNAAIRGCVYDGFFANLPTGTYRIGLNQIGFFGCEIAETGELAPVRLTFTNNCR